MSATSPDKGKKLPVFTSDEEVEAFIDTADLSEYDLSEFKPMRFEFLHKQARVNMRMPQAQLDAVKAAAAKKGVPYQRFIREVLEQALAKPQPRRPAGGQK